MFTGRIRDPEHVAVLVGITGSSLCQSSPPKYQGVHSEILPVGDNGLLFWGIAIPAMGFPYAGSCRAAGFGGENLAGPKTPKWEI